MLRILTSFLRDWQADWKMGYTHKKPTRQQNWPICAEWNGQPVNRLSIQRQRALCIWAVQKSSESTTVYTMKGPRSGRGRPCCWCSWSIICYMTWVICLSFHFSHLSPCRIWFCKIPVSVLTLCPPHLFPQMSQKNGVLWSNRPLPCINKSVSPDLGGTYLKLRTYRRERASKHIGAARFK